MTANRLIFSVTASLLLLIVASCKTDAPAAEGQDPAIAQAVAAVNSDSIATYINDLVSFGTRHTMSSQTDPEHGIGAALTYLENKCSAWVGAPAVTDGPELTVSDHKPSVRTVWYEAGGPASPESRMDRRITVPNLMVTLPGTEGNSEIVMLAHMDTRVNDLSDSTSFAPGANDDGSGVACLMEMVRVLSGMHLRQTVKCIFVSGEEQNLLGSAYMARKAKDENWPIIAVISNDMISNIQASGTGLTTDKVVRVFSDSPHGEDSDSRQLARYIKEFGEQYVPGHEVRLIYRNDRYRRGGDHSSFLAEGFPSVRMCEFYESYDRTHQYVRQEDGIDYGDVPAGVNIPYLTRNIQVNVAAAANLAQAPSKPAHAEIANANALSNSTILAWTPSVNADGSEDTSAQYQILWRDTDQSVWNVYPKDDLTFARNDDGNLTVELPLSKDDYFFAIRSVTATGNASLPAVCNNRLNVDKRKGPATRTGLSVYLESD